MLSDTQVKIDFSDGNQTQWYDEEWLDSVDDGPIIVWKGNKTCPLCGCDGRPIFNLFDCSNRRCKNFQQLFQYGETGITTDSDSVIVGSNPSTFTNLSAIRRTIRCGMLTHAKVPSVVRR